MGIFFFFFFFFGGGGLFVENLGVNLISATKPIAFLPRISEIYQRASKDQSYLPLWASDINFAHFVGR